MDTPDTHENALYVWLAEGVTCWGDIASLCHQVEFTTYADLEAPHHVLTEHNNQWASVKVISTCTGRDNDFTYYELTCSWADRSESIGYRIDGRA